MRAPCMGTKAHSNWASPFGMDPSTAGLALTHYASSNTEGYLLFSKLEKFCNRICIEYVGKTEAGEPKYRPLLQ